MIQTCTVHLIRSSMRFVSYSDRQAVAASLRPIYTAADEAAARSALDAFADFGGSVRNIPRAVVASWEDARVG